MILTIGKKGQDVSDLQTMLRNAGFYPYPLNIDGDFGIGTYRAVCAFQQKNSLQVDGIAGKQTMSVLYTVSELNRKQVPYLDWTAEKVVQAVLDKGYTLREKEGVLNPVAVRTDDIFDNRFTDALFVLRKEGGKWVSTYLKWTTMPGTYGGVFAPITTPEGVTGTACIAEGQYLNAYTFVNDYAGWLSYPYFYQKNLSFYRDGNMDTTLDRKLVQHYAAGLNLHYMGEYDTEFVNSVYSVWSIGCNGAPKPTFATLVNLAQRAMKVQGTDYDYTLLHLNDFK